MWRCVCVRDQRAFGSHVDISLPCITLGGVIPAAAHFLPRYRVAQLPPYPVMGARSQNHRPHLTRCHDHAVMATTAVAVASPSSQGGVQASREHYQHRRRRQQACYAPHPGY